MWFEEFQDGPHCSHLWYWNRTILAILNFHNTPISPIKFKLNQTYHWGVDVIWRFSRCQDGCHGEHLGYQNRTILAILNLPAAPMFSTKFLLHPTYGSGAYNNWKPSRWSPCRPSWIPFWRRCWKCEKLLMDIRVRDRPWSTDHSNRPWSADHSINWPWPGAKLQVSLQLKLFKMAAVVAIVDNKQVLATLNLHATPMPPIKFWFNLTYHWKQMRFENFQNGHLGAIIYRNRMILAILTMSLQCLPPCLG